MGFENAPVVVFAPRFHPDIAYFALASIFLIVAVCLYHLRYIGHMNKHLIPPAEWRWMCEKIWRWRA